MSTSANNQQNVVGMSVVGSDFEELKRFNIEELRQAVPPGESESKVAVKNKEDT